MAGTYWCQAISRHSADLKFIICISFGYHCLWISFCYLDYYSIHNTTDCTKYLEHARPMLLISEIKWWHVAELKHDLDLLYRGEYCIREEIGHLAIPLARNSYYKSLQQETTLPYLENHISCGFYLNSIASPWVSGKYLACFSGHYFWIRQLTPVSPAEP